MTADPDEAFYANLDVPDRPVTDEDIEQLPVFDDEAPGDDSPADVLAMADEYARLYRISKAQKGDLDATKAAMADLDAKLQEAMLEKGSTSFNVNGNTVFLSREIRANKNPAVDENTFYERLRAAGLGDFVTKTVSASRLAGWARELIDADQPIPDDLAAVINVHQMYKVGVRKAPARRAVRKS